MLSSFCPPTGSRSLLLVVMLTSPALATDWPQYRGPNHNGHTDAKVATAWPAGGPQKLWQVPTPGGFSTFAVAEGRAVTLMARELEGTRREVCVAFDAATGKELWAAPLGQARYDGGGDSGTSDNKGGDGPRSTPALADGRVFVLDARLVLTCLKADNGETLWSKDLVRDFGGQNIRWQNAASPVVDQGRILVGSGSADGSLMAFKAADGSVLWKAEQDALTHATPAVAEIHGVRQVVFFTQSGLVSVQADNGKILWRYPFTFRISTAASPVIEGDLVFCSAGYDVGSAAVRIKQEGGAFKAEELWKLSGTAATKASLVNHWSTPLAKDGHLYGMFGFKEYGRGALKCVEFATGKQVWSQPDFGPGGVILAGGRLLALSDRGEVVAMDPQPAGYKELGRFKAVEGKCWNNPTVADGRLFVRSTREGAAFDITTRLSRR